MSSFRTIVRYCNAKIEYTKAIVTLTKYSFNSIGEHWNSESEFNYSHSWADVARNVYVGDMVMLKDPMNSGDYLVRKLAAVEGYEMASTDEKEEPFVLEKNDCWVLAENNDLKPKGSYDSRTFGPVSMTDIVGRVIYCLSDNVDHGPVKNSNSSVREDSPVLVVELDVDEMKKNHKQ